MTIVARQGRNVLTILSITEAFDNGPHDYIYPVDQYIVSTWYTSNYRKRPVETVLKEHPGGRTELTRTWFLCLLIKYHQALSLFGTRQ